MPGLLNVFLTSVMVILDDDVIGSVYKWRNKIRPRKAEWPAGVTINFGGQDWNSGLLTPGPWSFHCPPAAS